MIAWCLIRLNSKFFLFMAEKESTNPLFSNPLEAYPGLTVADLNPVSYTHLTLPTIYSV